MSNYAEINIKEGMPYAADALRDLQNSIESLKRRKVKCALIIHGYGSTGQGGIICEKARLWLKAQERQNKLRAVIYGEEFNIFNFKALELKNRYPELTPLLDKCNHGVTAVEI